MKLHSFLLTPVFAAMIVLISASPSFAQDNVRKPRLISVTGTGEVNSLPDAVSMWVGIEYRDKDLAAAKAQADARARKVLGLAREAGVEPRDIKTSAVRLAPEYSDEKVPRLLGYVVSETIAITLTDISKYDVVMPRLVEGGINRVDNINFFVHDTRRLRDEARSRAIRAAKEKAVAMAQELGETVGKPWEISETPENRYGVMANAVAFDTSRGSTEGGEPTVAPGQVTIRASVNVSFELQ